MNGLITEGIPLGVPVQILTSGLSLGDPVPPTPVVTTSGLLYLGQSFPIVNNKTGVYVSPYYVLPAGTTRLTGQITGTVTGAAVYGSIDGVNFSAILLDFPGPTPPSFVSIRTNARFVYASSTGTGITIRINPRREKF